MSLILDLARTRTLFFYTNNDAVAIVNAVGYGVKLILFILENIEKRQWLLPEFARASHEETCGALNRALFIWLNSLFIQGFHNKLTVKQLFALDKEIELAATPTGLMDEWESGM